MKNKRTDATKEDFVLYEVWDPLTRLLHWLNAFCILSLSILGGVLYFRADLGLSNYTIDSIVSIHVYFGYIFTAGIIVRWIWLFAGPPLSTWQDILPTTEKQLKTAKQTLRFYLKGFRGKPPFYVAHNPLTGFAYITFFVAGALQVITGLILNQIPPLPSGERLPPGFLITIHDIGFYIILVYMVIHVFSVLIHEFVEKRSIIASMVHGKKVFRKEEVKMAEEYIDRIEK